MSESSSNNNAIVAIVAIIVLAMAGYFAYQHGMFGHQKSGVNIELHTN